MLEIWINIFFRFWEKEIQYRGEKMGANRNEFIENASKILLSKSEEYKCIIDKIEHYLNELLEDVKGITISGRSKDANNIAEKIYRKNYMMKYNDAAKFIEELPDGIGVRIICLLNQDEVKIYKHLIDRMPDERRIGNKSFRYRQDGNFFVCTENQPEKQKNNLDIYRMDCIWVENEKQVRVELQIKSLTNYFWGEIEHSLFYKNYDFTIGNSFYSGLMKNIHNELQNIDVEMASLENHMKKSEHNQILEIRQISASMISQKFSVPIQKIVGCKIDLRESFMLLTDMHFGISSNVKDNLEKFNADYLRYTTEVCNTCIDHDLSGEYMVIGTSAIVNVELDGAVGMNSGIFNNPFMIWGRYRMDGEKALLSISFQFHHTQMDGAHAGKFLKNLQEEIERLPYLLS